VAGLVYFQFNRRAMKIETKTFLLVIALSTSLVAKSQITSSRLQQYVTNGDKLLSLTIHSPDAVNQFYSYQNFQVVWLNNGQQSLRNELFDLLTSASRFGLNESDYLFEKSFAVLNSLNDSLAAEIRLTDIVLHFIQDILYGNSPPQFGYNGLMYRPSCFDIPLLLSTYLKAGRLNLLLHDVEIKSTEYIAIKNQIIRYDTLIHHEHFREINIISTTISSSNLPLMTKLYQLGILDSLNKKISDIELKAKIKEVQKLFGLLPDGILRTSLLTRLNVPLQIRLEELKKALNTTRWLNCMVNNEPTIVVNIPSATLLVYEKGKIILESKIIVGKRSTPTPTLTSKVNEVILYPYWMVPHSIAIKELLPIIKRNSSYLAANGYQVLNEKGRIVNPRSINWQNLGSGYFPYRIRQSTGCDNSLGLIKLNFYNPYSVYLHDTPGKSLFNASSRYFSHGCMRVEKAMELAYLLLAGNTIAVDTLEEKGCLRNQAPITATATHPMNVIVLYNTAWFNSAGEVSFSEDIYRKNAFLQPKEWASDNNRYSY
jgi:murein L,D-transpeptidase YcbB/YkuD